MIESFTQNNPLLSVNDNTTVSFELDLPNTAGRDPDDTENGLTDEAVTFFNNSRLGGDVVSSQFRWSFGDGTTVTTAGVESVEHTYTTPGEYEIVLTLSIERQDGSTATLTAREELAVDVLPRPMFNARVDGELVFGEEAIPPGTEVAFFNITGGTLTNPQLNFGDGSPPEPAPPIDPTMDPPVPSVTHVYDAIGTFNPALSGTFVHQFTGTTLIAQTIRPGLISVFDTEPSTRFSIESNCIPVTGVASFLSLADLGGGAVESTRFLWDFGDGTTEEVIGVPAVAHQYNEAGSFTVSLTVTIDIPDFGEASDTAVVEDAVFVGISGATALDDYVSRADESFAFEEIAGAGLTIDVPIVDGIPGAELPVGITPYRLTSQTWRSTDDYERVIGGADADSATWEHNLFLVRPVVPDHASAEYGDAVHLRRQQRWLALPWQHRFQRRQCEL